MAHAKSKYRSKTLWANIIALLAEILQAQTGEEVLDPGARVGLLAVVNCVLRFFTHEELS